MEATRKPRWHCESMRGLRSLVWPSWVWNSCVDVLLNMGWSQAGSNMDLHKKLAENEMHAKPQAVLDMTKAHARVEEVSAGARAQKRARAGQGQGNSITST